MSGFSRHDRRTTAELALVVAVVVTMAAGAGARPLHAGAPTEAGPSATPSPDSVDVARTVERFHRAIATGDSTTALSLLAADATVLESGDVESLAEYRAHHLPADIEFSRAVKEARTPVRVMVRGDAAWAVGTGSSLGTFRGRAIDSASAELMVLTRTADGWRIAAIHWSSRQRRK